MTHTGIIIVQSCFRLRVCYRYLVEQPNDGGTPSTYMQYNQIHHNVLVANYPGVQCLGRCWGALAPTCNNKTSTCVSAINAPYLAHLLSSTCLQTQLLCKLQPPTLARACSPTFSYTTGRAHSCIIKLSGPAQVLKKQLTTTTAAGISTPRTMLFSLATTE